MYAMRLDIVALVFGMFLQNSASQWTDETRGNREDCYEIPCQKEIEYCDVTPQCARKKFKRECKRNCSNPMFQECMDKNCCVSYGEICDGNDDCGDGSDENFCGGCGNLRTCPNGNCVDKMKICDGYNDCGDLSDERACPGDPWDWVWAVVGEGSDSWVADEEDVIEMIHHQSIHPFFTNETPLGNNIYDDAESSDPFDDHPSSSPSSSSSSSSSTSSSSSSSSSPSSPSSSSLGTDASPSSSSEANAPSLQSESTSEPSSSESKLPSSSLGSEL